MFDVERAKEAFFRNPSWAYSDGARYRFAHSTFDIFPLNLMPLASEGDSTEHT